MRIKMKPTSYIIASFGLNPSGDVQRFFTNTCALRMDKYVPFDTGALAESVAIDGQINPSNVYDDKIVYNQVYARYVYYGVSKNGNDLHYQTDKHALAGKKWDQQMWSAEKDIITREVQNYMKVRGKR